jgi:hypothetical protein
VRADAISFCSSPVGEHTFSTLTLTGGDPGCACCAKANSDGSASTETTKIFGSTAAFYQAPRFRPLALASRPSCGLPRQFLVECRDGELNPGLRHAIASGRRSCRGRRSSGETKEWARCTRDHAHPGRQQRRNREATAHQPGSVFRFLPGDLKYLFF